MKGVRKSMKGRTGRGRTGGNQTDQGRHRFPQTFVGGPLGKLRGETGPNALSGCSLIRRLLRKRPGSLGQPFNGGRDSNGHVQSSLTPFIALSPEFREINREGGAAIFAFSLRVDADETAHVF